MYYHKLVEPYQLYMFPHQNHIYYISLLIILPLLIYTKPISAKT